MSELKPCPFCGSAPVFPDAIDVFGTCYEAGCEECRLGRIDFQIIDCFDWPRDDLHNSWNDKTLQYGSEFVEIVRQKAINAWNTRATDAELAALRERAERAEAEVERLRTRLDDAESIAERTLHQHGYDIKTNWSLWFAGLWGGHDAARKG